MNTFAAKPSGTILAAEGIFYTDNGKGFKNQKITAILARLGITCESSRPYNPQRCGISERSHQTILIKAAKTKDLA
jgi:transposase InsO family protein